ncbi:glycosyltransferase family 4 protein [Paenibacillus sp. JCM 10914]|uniref:glycosyltransferase n=1 Tax=Paenibacillus sp. JCM 10914 TaxID=1236974 RepID=UPI0003CC4BAF|nr:glycosyltransferase [Paenibacillus sp. JCM 10914]GAE07326.1 glycosyl transferase, group 1 [Paenibacillus sp. JCM 10914]
MKIMHVSLGLPPLRTGGLTKYSVDLMLEQKQQSHEVVLVYPGHTTWPRITRVERCEDYEGIEVYEIVNPLPVPLLGGIRRPHAFMKESPREPFQLFLQQLQPDVIHFHTFMGVHKELLEAAKAVGIRMVYTTHDYFGICPKVNLLDQAGQVCRNFRQGLGCVSCNEHGYSLAMIYMMQSRVYSRFKNSYMVKQLRRRVRSRSVSMDAQSGISTRFGYQDHPLASAYLELRAYYMDMFHLMDRLHFNSSVSRDEYGKHGLTHGDVVTIRHRDITDQRRLKLFLEDQPLRITYLGPVDHYKGFGLLKRSLDQLLVQSTEAWHLHIYGNDVVPTNWDKAKYTFHGKYHYSELNTILEQTDLLIVPSVWKETFGFVGLEGLAHAVPMVVSRYAGCKDLIQDGITGWICEPHEMSLVQHLDTIVKNRDLLRKMNRRMLAMEIDFTMSTHAMDITDWYSNAYEEVLL